MNKFDITSKEIKKEKREMESIYNKKGGHYNIFRGLTIEDLIDLFPDGEANEMNFALFSTSGVHGTYSTIEDVIRSHYLPKDNEEYLEEMSVTVLVIHPRLVCMKYGHVYFKEEHIDFLKKLRDSSKQAIMKIGVE
jgi:hypothetical protein